MSTVFYMTVNLIFRHWSEAIDPTRPCLICRQSLGKRLSLSLVRNLICDIVAALTYPTVSASAVSVVRFSVWLFKIKRITVVRQP